ncbi:MAG: hypothetical protein M1826_001970 [Phylliscum demangeonii]|nr:MAG: hypothetical protein M1826_001970 [Phylliscum demangeonii]
MAHEAPEAHEAHAAHAAPTTPTVAQEAAVAEAGVGATMGGPIAEASRGAVPDPSPKALDGHTPPEAASDDEERSGLQIAVIMGALCMGVLLVALDQTIITTALPTISEHFGSSAGYTWIGSAYLLANAASVPSWGKLSDIWGRKPVLLVATSFFFVASALCGAASSIGMLIVGRAVQGIGGGGIVILVNICISDMFSMRKRALYFGLVGLTWAFASGIGPILGGVFTQKASWRWCFYINLPCSGLTFGVLFFFLKLETPTTSLAAGLKAIDWIGIITIVSGTVMVLLGLEFGGVTFPWSSATVICLIVCGLLAGVAFVINEWKFARHPIIPLRLFGRRSNCAALLTCFIHGFVFIAGFYYLPLYFQAVRGATPLLSGVYLLPFVFTLSIFVTVTGLVIRRTGRYLETIWFGTSVMTLGLGLFVRLGPTSSWAEIVLYQLVAGVGVGPNFQAPLIALLSLIPPRDIATATATFGFTRNLATSISVVVGGVVFQNAMQTQLGRLQTQLGPALAAELGGAAAGANVRVVNALPPAQRAIARQAFAAALRQMWILFVAVSAVGIVVSLFIGKQTLSKEHHRLSTTTSLTHDSKSGGKAAEKAPETDAPARAAEKV